MKISHTVAPALRGGTVLAFVLLCAMIFGFLWTNAGGRIPMVTKTGYEVTIPMTDVDNLVFQSDVRIAGVDVGKIEELQIDGREALVTLDLDHDVAPLHEGATVTVRNKTMIEETYLEIVDGEGAAYADGAELPPEAARGSVQINDILTSLDAQTRKDLSAAIRASGTAVEGTRQDVDAMLTGLSDIGGNASALDALAQQSKDLRSLLRSSTRVLDAMDTQQGRIVDLVRDSQRLTDVTSEHKTDIEALMRALPPLLDNTRSASDSLAELSDPLGTVASNLRGSSKDLDAALRELPATAGDLRGMLPSLDLTLTRAPATLKLLPPFAVEASPLLRTLQGNVADLNPMLAYLRPYGPDLVSYWSNHTGFVGTSDGNGPIGRVKPVFNANSLNLGAALTPMTMYNPYPAPGTHMTPRDWSGEYPRIEEDPVP